MNLLFSKNWKELTTAQEQDLGWQNLWIYDQGSLTEKLRSIYKEAFCVKVLYHSFVQCTEKAAFALNLKAGDTVLYREVMLCDGDIPLVFASSLLPEVALVGRFDELKRLGSRPLGHWIFSEPVLVRSQIHTIDLPSDASLFARLAPKPLNTAVISGRKTLFTGPDKPFLVSEFFLPSIQGKS